MPSLHRESTDSLIGNKVHAMGKSSHRTDGTVANLVGVQYSRVEVLKRKSGDIFIV